MRTLTPYWTSQSLASDIFGEMDRFLGGLDSVAKQIYDERKFDPVCEIVETEDRFLMSVDLPGMKKEDIKIEVANDLLTISGERRRQTVSEQNRRVQLYEKSYGLFKRSFALPMSVEANDVEARYENGVLELHLPKSPAAKPRQIEIQSARDATTTK